MKITNTVVEKHGLKIDEYSKIKELFKKRAKFIGTWYFFCNVE